MACSFSFRRITARLQKASKGQPYPGIGSAPANIVHCGAKLILRGMRRGADRSGSRHDHSRLAIAALRYRFGEPRNLNRMAAVRGEPLNGLDRTSRHGAHRQNAATCGDSVQVDRACATNADSAAKLCPVQLERLAQNPQQWRICSHVQLVSAPVDCQNNRDDLGSSIADQRTSSPVAPMSLLPRRHDGQQQIAGLSRAGVQRRHATEDRFRSILGVVMQERPDAREVILHV